MHSSCSSTNIPSLILYTTLLISSYLSAANCLPTMGTTLDRTERQLGFGNGNGMGMSFSESMSMAGSMNNGFFGGNGMSMAESMGMAMDAGVRNVNGFPMPYFDASMSMSDSEAFNFRQGR